MDHPCQPSVDATLTRPSGTLSRRERDWWQAVWSNAISVRQQALLIVVLQLQLRYRKCAHFREGAYIEVENVRTASLRTKGAYISGSDVRTCNFEAMTNRLRFAQARRRGERFLPKVICAPLAG